MLWEVLKHVVVSVCWHKRYLGNHADDTTLQHYNIVADFGGPIQWDCGRRITVCLNYRDETFDMASISLSSQYPRNQSSNTYSYHIHRPGIFPFLYAIVLASGRHTNCLVWYMAYCLWLYLVNSADKELSLYIYIIIADTDPLGVYPFFIIGSQRGLFNIGLPKGQALCRVFSLQRYFNT